MSAFGADSGVGSLSVVRGLWLRRTERSDMSDMSDKSDLSDKMALVRRAEALGVGFWRRLRRCRPPLSQPNAPKQPPRSSTTADALRVKVAGQSRSGKGAGLAYATAVREADCPRD